MMLYTSLVMVLMAASSLATLHHPQPRAERREETPTATPTADTDWARISDVLHSYAGSISVSALFGKPTATLGISIPSSLRNEIITAVPASVVIQLMMNSDYRASVASDFQEGKTPKWYDDLKPELKTFFENMAESIAHGDGVVTRTSTRLLPTDEPESDDEDRTAVEDDTETSTSDSAAMPTGASREMMAAALGMAGVLGIALGL